MLMSAVHGIYRLVNSTFELKDMVQRLSRLVCQIFGARYCLILLLDPSKKYSLHKCRCHRQKKTHYQYHREEDHTDILVHPQRLPDGDTSGIGGCYGRHYRQAVAGYAAVRER
jgi:hypothetical protein